MPVEGLGLRSPKLLLYRPIDCGFGDADVPKDACGSYENELFGMTGEIVARARACIGAVVVEDIRVTDVRGEEGMASEEGELDNDGDLNGCINETDGLRCMLGSTDLNDDFEPCTERMFM